MPTLFRIAGDAASDVDERMSIATIDNFICGSSRCRDEKADRPTLAAAAHALAHPVTNLNVRKLHFPSDASAEDPVQERDRVAQKVAVGERYQCSCPLAQSI